MRSRHYMKDLLGSDSARNIQLAWQIVTQPNGIVVIAANSRAASCAWTSWWSSAIAISNVVEVTDTLTDIQTG